jgi:hypothetical protein
MSELNGQSRPFNSVVQDFNGVIVGSEANYWWRTNDSYGALLNKLMLLFIVGPIALVAKEFYTLSFIVFAFMVPYGFFVRYLAVRAVLRHLANHPEARESFEHEGIISS